ncbi:MAG: hypothetical protein V4730_11950 [Pseudomonadota bacterium]
MNTTEEEETCHPWDWAAELRSAALAVLAGAVIGFGIGIYQFFN